MARRCTNESSIPAVFLLLFAFFPFLVHGFKDHEFKTCDQAHFCKRNRNREPGNSSMVLGDLSFQSGNVLGVLKNTEYPGVSLRLDITAYRGDILRLRIDEDPATKVNRYKVPDVLVPDLDSKASPLAEGARHFSVDVSSVPVSFGPYTAVLKKEPFSLWIYKEDQLLLSFNGKGLFSFEHRRKKQEGDEEGLWEESFHSHRDSKPNGPEAISFDVSFHGAEHVYGIPERAMSLSLPPSRGPATSSPPPQPYRLYNLDVFEYLAESPFGLYGSIPFMMAHGRNEGRVGSTTTGIFWLNAAEMWVDVMAPGWEGAAAAGGGGRGGGGGGRQIDTHWIAEAGILDLFLFTGPTPAAVVEQYTAVTGTTSLPQLFSIAYHQCRWNYKDEADVAEVDKNFDLFDIPYDVLWLDIEHTDGKRYMTWDAARFPHPAEMQEKMADKGRKMVTIIDPHVKRDEGYPLHREAKEKGYYVKDATGKDFDGWCWPGSSSYLDVTDPKIREWWATKFSYSSYAGSTPTLYTWNDMNEPSVFNGPEVTMHKDNLHAGGFEHRAVHNAYGYYYHLATAEGLRLRNEGANDRPFVLSRAVYAGTQRAGPIWTGDNTADWEHLRVSIPMLLSLGLSGMAFSGADVGGFFGNPDAQLLLRWYQMGVFYPFFRAHAHLDTKRREPWLFGEPYTSLIREAVRTRYSLLPFLYTQFYHAYKEGLPVIRPFFFEYPDDPDTHGYQEGFLLGADILVRPVLHPDVPSVEVFFPGSEPWYEMKTGLPWAPSPAYRKLHMPVSLDTMPVFLRAGSIIPRKDRARRSSSHMKLDPYTLVVVLNSSRQAAGELYLDDGSTFDFQAGAFIHRRFVFSDGVLTSTNAATPPAVATGQVKDGPPLFSSQCVVERIVIMGLPLDAVDVTRRALINGDKGTAEEMMGPPWLRGGVHPTTLVVKSPKVSIAEDWSIKVLGQ